MSHTHHESHTQLRAGKHQPPSGGICEKDEFVCVLKGIALCRRSLHRRLSVDILSTLPRGIPQCSAAEAGCLVTAWCAYSSDGHHQRV